MPAGEKVSWYCEKEENKGNMWLLACVGVGAGAGPGVVVESVAVCPGSGAGSVLLCGL